jgi:threonyl-tRNA synthetase
LFKTCTVCKMKLPIESFDKYRYQCKECRREYKKEKYKTNIINQGNSKTLSVTGKHHRALTALCRTGLKVVQLKYLLLLIKNFSENKYGTMNQRYTGIENDGWNP